MTDLILRDAAIDALTELSCDDNAHWGAIIDAIRTIPTIDPAAIREAALREAVDAITAAKVFSENDSDGESAAKVIALGRAHKAILALIGEKK